MRKQLLILPVALALALSVIGWAYSSKSDSNASKSTASETSGQKFIAASSSEIPAWFKQRMRVTETNTAQQLTKEYSSTGIADARYADSFFLLGNYAKAKEIYSALASDAYRRRLKNSIHTAANEEETVGKAALAVASKFLAQAQYSGLLASSSSDVPALQALYNDNKNALLNYKKDVPTSELAGLFAVKAAIEARMGANQPV
jgi:hypothetical protein